MNTRNRPTWDETFMSIAKVVAKRSTCLRRNVGAVITKDNKLLTTGYNGAPVGLAHCTDELSCIRMEMAVPSGQRHEVCRAVHAEANAVIQAALHGVTTQGATIYVTDSPCSICARMIINAGIQRVVFDGEYPDEMTRGLLQEAGIRYEKYKGSKNKLWE